MCYDGRNVCCVVIYPDFGSLLLQRLGSYCLTRGSSGSQDTQRQTVADVVSIGEPQRYCGTIVSQLMARLKTSWSVLCCRVSCTTAKAEVSSRVAAVNVDERHYMSRWYVELYFNKACSYVHVSYLS